MDVIPTVGKYPSTCYNNGKISPFSVKDNPPDNKSVGQSRKKHRYSVDQESESDRNLSPIPPNLPVFSGSPSGSSSKVLLLNLIENKLGKSGLM